MGTTPNLLIDLLATNQASPEITANDALSKLDQALTNQKVITIGDGDYILADNPPDTSEARYNMALVFKGSLTRYRFITVPQSSKLYIMSNQTTGGSPLVIRTSAAGGPNEVILNNTGSGSPFTFSDYVLIYCDGYNVLPVAAGVQMVTPPTHNTSLGVPGQIAYDSTHLYICVGTNTWKRVTIGDSW